MAAVPISACVQLAEELRALGLPLLQPLPAKNNGAGGGSKPRAPMGATDLSELRWDTRQGVLLALLAEIPGSPAGPALQQLVAQRRAARRAEKELERRGRPEELGLLPEYVRREEDGFRRRFMAAVGEELQRQVAPKPLLAATADPARMLGDRGLCLRVIEFFVARHRSRTRMLAGLQQRILSPPAPPASPSPAAAAAATAGTPVASSATTSRSSARKVPSSAARRNGMATPVQQRPPSPLVMEPSTSSSSSSALRSERRRSATKAPTSVAELSSPLLRQGIRRLSLQGGGGGALWSPEQQEQEAPAPVVVASAERAARRRSSVSGSKTPASKLVEGDGLVEEERERPRQSEEVMQVQSKPKVKPWAQGNSSGVCVKDKVEEQQQVGLAELLPPVRGPRKEKPAAAVRAAAPPAAALEGHEGVLENGMNGDLRAENARLRAELGEAQALYEALMRGQRATGDRVDARCLALVEQQGAMLAREAAGLRREVDGYRDLAEGATALLGGVEAFCQELLAHARGEESTNKNGRRRSSHFPVPPPSSAEFWAAALAEAKELHGRWRSAKRASRVKHQHHLLLPHDARVFLRRPAERAGVAAGGEAAVPVPLSGEWEDRARLRGEGGGEEEEGGSGLSLDPEGVRGLSRRVRGLVAALDEALQEGNGTSDGLCALRDQARALQLHMAQLGLAAAHAHAGSSPVSAVKVMGERALLEAFDGLLVPRLRPQELRERVDGLRRLVLAERGALAKGMASALEEAVAWRRRGGRGGDGGGRLCERGDGV